MNDCLETRNVDFGKLRTRTQTILKRLLGDAQGLKNFRLDSRPMGRLFTQKELESMVGKSRTTLRKLEETIRSKMESGELSRDYLPDLDVNPNTQRIIGYPFSWVQALRLEAGTLPWRDPKTDDPFILSVIQFKGGVGKTETVSNSARYFALQGYRVLVVDMDHQGSCTGSFGYSPEISFGEKDTVIPYIKGEKDSLDYAIFKTAWPNIDLIPGCLALEEFNWTMAQHALEAETKEEKRQLYYELRRGIDTISENYDIIIIDSPPSSSINSFAIIAASDGMVIPIPPRKHDLASTEQFLTIVERLTHRSIGEGNGSEIDGVLYDKDFKFVRFLVTQFVNEGNRSSNDADFYEICRAIFGVHCYEKVFRMMSSIKEAARNFTTVYEGSRKNKTVIKELDSVFRQIELDILRHWPSKSDELRKEGLGG